jgi:hypothetical protein
MTARRGDRRIRSIAALLAGATALLWLAAAPVPAAAATPLLGTFTLTPGSCAGGTVSGTYLRMILPSGSPSGPYMSNSDSRCADQSYTPLAPGSDGGLVSGSYQPTPNPPFDKSGNALAGRITAPSPFYGTSFATSSNARDPQTGLSVAAPLVTASGGSLHADLRAFSVTWNNQYFNQGAPKPDGSLPGNTRAATGSYDAATGAFTLSWTSQVVGGPFDKFTGQWHLAGRFVASGGGRSTTAATEPATGSAGGASTASRSAQGQTSMGGSARNGAPLAASTVSAPAGADGAAQPAQQLAASTTTVTRDRWRVSWWVIALTAAIAVAGLATVVWLNREIRRGNP